MLLKGSDLYNLFKYGKIKIVLHEIWIIYFIFCVIIREVIFYFGEIFECHPYII